jgi:hypothetical protein
VDPSVVSAFGLDPDVLHLNHGAFGVAPVAVRQAAAAWRERAERNPHRFNRVEVSGLITAAREGAAVPAPTMRLVPLPAGVLTAPGQVDPFYEALSRQQVEVAPVWFDGTGYLRIAAAPYNTPDDYSRLAASVRSLLDGR